MAGAEDQDPTVDIGRDGDIGGFSRAARRRLAASSGRYRLLPSPAGLLIWERIDDASTGKPAPAVALAGEIGGPGALADVLNFIHFNQWDGTLWVVSDATRRALFFAKGQLLSAQSTVPSERLGGTLLRMGAVEPDQLAVASREVRPNRKLGTILVEQGLVGTHVLFEAVRRQVEETFHAVLLMNRGAFYFTKAVDESVASRLHLDTQSLLLESLRRIDEMAYFREKLPSPEVVLGLRDKTPPGSLVGDVLVVYGLVDDRRTLADIIRDSRLGEFAATKAAFELVSRGLATVRQSNIVMRAKSGTVLPGGVAGGPLVEAYAGGIVLLHESLAAEGKQAVLAEGVQAFVAGSAKYADLMKDVALDPSGQLPRGQLMSNLLAAGAPAESLSRLREALAELLLFVLFLAHDHISRELEQAVHERVAHALEQQPG